jgi:hypothetical protein
MVPHTSLGDALGELQDAIMIGALHGHVDRGRHGGLYGAIDVDALLCL